MSNRVLLVNPRLTRRPARFNVPVGIVYLGTELNRNGFDVEILDANNASSYRDFAALVASEADGCLAVGFSVMTAQIASGLELSAATRSAHPDMPIIWGGVHPTLYPQQVAQHPLIDYVVKGEGEIVATTLLVAIRDRMLPEDNIPVWTESQPFKVDKWAYPNWRLFRDIRDIGVRKASTLTGIGLPLLESRNCPHRCAFCINSVTGGKYRFRSAKNVVDDLVQTIEQGVRHISFFDEDFFANRKRLVEVLSAIDQLELQFQWFGTARADYFRDSHIDRALMQQIRDSGCKHLGIGAESGSQRVLDDLKKDITVDDTIHAAEALAEVGINADFSFMIGLPGEEVRDVDATIGLVEKIAGMSQGFRILGPFIYRPYPGSELHQRCLTQGMSEPGSLDKWVGSPFVSDTTGPEDYHLYTWIRYPLEKLQRVVFYCWLAGIRVKSKMLTGVLRAVGQWRCRRRYWGLAWEMGLVEWARKTGIDRKMSRGKF